MSPRNILVPTQLDAMSSAALIVAASLAKQVGAKVTLLHVYEPPSLDLPEGMLTGLADTTSRVVEAAEKLLTSAVEEQRTKGIDIEWQLAIGRPWRKILEVAERLQDAWIVMGTHGRRGVERALLGSVAEKVVRRAACPVLTIPGPHDGP